MRTSRTLTAILAAAFGVLPLSAAVEGPGALAPLQNRTGDSELGPHVEGLLRNELSLAGYVLVDPRPVRDTLRRHRLRYVDLAAPDELAQAAKDLDVTWILSCTLHDAVVENVPRITVSARLYVAGQSTIAWAGFESRDGLDSGGVLGLDVIGDFDTLARNVLRQLIADLDRSGEAMRAGTDWKSDRSGYLSESVTIDGIGVVAVIPFDSVADLDPSGAAETVTSLTLAVLDRHDVSVVVPGSVNHVLRGRGYLWRGAVDEETLEAVGEATGADTILTGTVETYAERGALRGGGPKVGVSGQLIDVASGRILWINGQNREGASGSFGSGRVRDPGTLAEGIVESLVQGFLRPTKRRNTEVTR